MIELFNKLLEVRDVAHLIHLNKSETQSKHEALAAFYTDLLKSLDLFVEVYQGQFGLINDFGSFGDVDYDDHIAYFETFAKYMQESRKNVVDESVHLNAIIDDIVIATYLLIYKLKFLQ